MNNSKLAQTLKVVFIFLFSNQYYYCNCGTNNFTLPHIRQGGWTPMPTKNSKLLSEKVISHIASDSIQSIVSTKPQAPHQSYQHKPLSQALADRHQTSHKQPKQQQNPDMMPIPVIKPHAHGTTLGFDLPDQGLTLYLDINELAAKPLAQNIGLEIVNHDSHQAQSSTQPLSAAQPASTLIQQNNSPKINKVYTSPAEALSQIANKVKNSNNEQMFAKPAPIVSKVQRRLKSPRLIGSYEGNAPSVQSKSNSKYQVGYMRPEDLHHALKQVGLSHSQEQHKLQSPAQFIMNNNNLNNKRDGQKSVSGESGAKRPLVNTQSNYAQNLNIPSTNINFNTNNSPQQMQVIDKSKVKIQAEVQTGFIPYTQKIPTKTESRYPTQEQETEKPIVEQYPTEDTQQVSKDYNVPTKSTELPSFPPEDMQQKSLDEDEREFTTKSLVSRDDRQTIEPPRQVAKDEDDSFDTIQQSLSPPQAVISTPTTNAHFSPPENNAVVQQLVAEPEKSTDRQCQQICAPITQNLITEANNLREVVTQLKADALLNTFPSLEEELQNFIDFSTTGYTIIMPSNKAISRLPRSLIDVWLKSQEKLNEMIDNHLLETSQTLEDLRVAQIIQPRSANAALRVNSAHNDTVTINGQPVSMANQMGPSGGVVHVVDGILFPSAKKDIMDTLKSCNRLDGFVTLAEGTAFADTLKQSGPYTVFVPSNEALQKVPDSDLDVIRNNMTALREFLKYHVAHGSHYSNDLRDGQFIPSLIDNHEIQVGVRTDRCSRRLVEANVSPLYRADIPASNGVIHVVDWILKPSDRDWCEGVILPR